MVSASDFGISVGDRVRVPWGFDDVVGEVVQLYRTGLGARAVVRLTEGADREETVTVPADSLAPLHDDRSTRADWQRYEEALAKALHTMFAGRTSSEGRGAPDQGIDLSVDVNGKRILVEAKGRGESHRVTSDDILAASGLARHGTPIVLVSNAAMTGDASMRLKGLIARHLPIYFVQWRSHADDHVLEQAIRRAAATT